MITSIINKNFIPTLDPEIELKRWRKLLNLANEPEPSVNHTPRHAVWKKNKATLWHYPAIEKKYDIPLFFVFSLFNRPYILDIAPGSSLIEKMVNAGYDVYLLDWGIPGHEDKEMTLENYIVDYIKKGVQRTLRHSGAKEVSIVGYCLGGTLASIYAAVAEEPIKNLVVACVPIDFSVSAVPDKWFEGLKNGTMSADRYIDVYGLIPPQYVNAMFRAVSSPVSFSPYVGLLSFAHDNRMVYRWRRMDKWTNDHVPFAGGAFRQLSIDLMRENMLVKGEFMVQGKKADLGNIKANLLLVTSKNDFLIPEEQSLPLMDLVSSTDKTYELVEAGHISLALSGKFASIMDSWLGERSISKKKVKQEK
ncbi:alpha/beta fold hydrolase [Bacillus sp. 1P10SD]|uniref:alpha/beta fold hydrolase n=1 Tax=Bacillus sp. 1P10SD TaxID=3132265 RepID=UPI0039A5C365